ncbi:hypothetical protein PCL_05897 [Purpureocillium lilacinum]|uniref:Uncharacterized protein n=1 Tax=Purpureocillium lilacinum TaxID=33203 RepID=A0A2U3EL47_PURLI|nr:hypothetical protein Purlil1_5893 [Purpureocillium lilacinum]PWI75239.1 hypothetical protein PCL_05897 [Purpureocillium lilacinum]
MHSAYVSPPTRRAPSPSSQTLSLRGPGLASPARASLGGARLKKTPAALGNQVTLTMTQRRRTCGQPQQHAPPRMAAGLRTQTPSSWPQKQRPSGGVANQTTITGSKQAGHGNIREHRGHISSYRM